jgi:nucleoid-associated protein EbfC
MNIQKLMKQAQQMQERLQRELEELSVEASAGGGMVTVTMSGHKHLLSVRIEPDVLDPEDPEMLQDLVVAAVNEASRKVDEAVQERMGGLAGGIGLPPGGF